MLSDKEQKKSFKKIASQQPDQYYPTSVLKREGFLRKQCSNCSLYFWSVNTNQTVCGDSICSGGFRFFEDNPSLGPLSYTDVWKRFSRMFEGFGYTPIKRYPVVARWNPTAEFTIASIAAFQPHVVAGESDPPAKKLIIPQFSIRFVDIDNVGITGSHMTGFVMIGQHQFVPKKEWNQAQAFEHILTWLREGIGLPNEEITFHEDAWAGGGNYGPCMEFFSRGVELGNQVYMLYEQTPAGEKELTLKVLDMGMGQERVAWFTQGTPTIYDATFPQVMKQLRKKASIASNELVMKKFIPFAGYLNVDEVEDLNKAWQDIATKIREPVDSLRSMVLPSAALYSIGEHCRTLLFALNDGALPSNVGGGYILRLLIRRCLVLI